MRHVCLLAVAVLCACGDDPITPLTATVMPVVTAEDTAKTFEIDANLPVSVTVTETPSHGVLTGGGTIWTYTPDPDYHGADAVGVLATTGGDTVVLAIPITVTSVNDAPVANPDAVATNADLPAVIDVALLLANDSDVEGGPLMLAAVASAAGGGAVLDGSQVTFTPNLGFAGDATFEYVLSDGEATATGLVTVSVGVDQAPLAVDDTATTPEDTTLELATATLLGNDSDPDGHALSISAVGNCINCTVVKTGSTIAVTPTPNSTADATFEYTVTDGALADTGVVTISVTPVPDPPIAGADTATTPEDTPLQLTAAELLANDSDADGDPLELTAVTGATLAGGVVTFTPVADASGDVEVTYTVSDGTGFSATGTLTITVVPVPDAPVAVADAIAVAEDTAGSVDVATNDTDADGDLLVVASFTQPAHGVVQFVGPVATYTPAADFHGSDAFSYTISDGNGGTATATVGVTIAPVNDAPIALDDSLQVIEDTATVLGVLANDLDVDGDLPTVTAVTPAVHGTVQLAGGVVSYTPDANFTGADGFDYTIADGHGGTASGHVAIAVTAVNDAPVAVADTLTTDENTPVSGDLVGNDGDVDGDTLTVQAFTQGAHGTVVFAGTTATYTPATNFSGIDTFSYTISDGNGGIATAAVTVQVGLDNDPPVAVDDLATVLEDAATVIDVLANDTDIDLDPLAVTAVTAPAHGTTTLTNGVVTYEPSPDYFGPDGFDYVIGDGRGGTDIGHVSVTVQNVNDPPVAVDDAATLGEDTSLLVDVTANDTDRDGDTLAIQASTAPAHGSVVFVANQARYTPAANYHGPDAFTYTVADGNGGTATASVAITVTPINDAPIAVDDAVATDEDTPKAIAVTVNDTDVDGDPLAIVSVTQPADGSVVFTATTATFTPAANFHGTSSFTYTVSDGNGGTATATVGVTVASINDAPIASAGAEATGSDTPIAIALSGSDVDGDPLAFRIVSGPSGGSLGAVVPLSPTSASVTFDPAGFAGTTAFVFEVDDGHGGTATATISIDVRGCGDGTLDAGEECDDGNREDGDGCEATCRFTCGSNGDDFIPDAVAVDPISGSCFAAYVDGVAYTSALELCASHGGHLATILDLGEHEAVLKVVGLTSEAWIGASDFDLDGEFAWETGEPFLFDGFAAGQPDHLPGENCLASTTEGWFDADCGKPIGFVCEFGDATCGDGKLDDGEECDDGNRTPGDGCELDCKLTCFSGSGAELAIVDPQTGSCFAGFEVAQLYGEAKGFCQAVGGTLATAVTPGEAIAVRDVATRMVFRGGWIAADDLLEESVFLWQTGEPVDAGGFAPGEPNDSGNDDCLVATELGWADVDCTKPFGGTICELERAVVVGAGQLVPFPPGSAAARMLDSLASYGTLTAPHR